MSIQEGEQFRIWESTPEVVERVSTLEKEMANLVPSRKRINRVDGRTSIYQNPEQHGVEKSISPQVISIFGRGIGYSDLQKKFVATPFFEQRVDKGHPYIVDYGIEPNAQDTEVRIAGAKSHIIGVANRLLQLSQKPELIIYSAGRPKYLSINGAPENVSEGSVLRELLHAMIPKRWWEGIDEEIHSTSLNSRTDALSVLQSASNYGFKNVDIYTIEPHCHRVDATTIDILQRPDGDNIKGVKNIIIRDSWQYLRNQDLISRVKGTLAYQRTLESEIRGIKKLLAGTYKSIQDTE